MCAITWSNHKMGLTFRVYYQFEKYFSNTYIRFDLWNCTSIIFKSKDSRNTTHFEDKHLFNHSIGVYIARITRGCFVYDTKDQLCIGNARLISLVFRMFLLCPHWELYGVKLNNNINSWNIHHLKVFQIIKLSFFSNIHWMNEAAQNP